MYYTYIHYRLDNNQPFYVGKGQKKRAWDKKDRNQYWHNIVNKHGYTAVIQRRFTNEWDAYSDEIITIAQLKLSGIKLTNLTNGGEGSMGAVRSDSFKNHLRNINKGKKRPPRSKEWALAISKAKTGTVIGPRSEKTKLLQSKKAKERQRIKRELGLGRNDKIPKEYLQ